jgi:hypothetical protein
MQNLQEVDLAWWLIEAAKPHLDVRERQHVFVSVGAGDSFTSIRIVLKLIAVKGISINPWLINLCATWLQAYVLHEDYMRLKLIIDGLCVSDTDLRPSPCLRCSNSVMHSRTVPISAPVYDVRAAVTRAR